jgi:hypothetical protein
VPTSPPPNDPSERPSPDFLSEHDLREVGIDPKLIPIACPLAVEYRGHGGVRCWASADLTALFGGQSYE